MFGIRLYLALLTLAFLVSMLLTNRFGVLAAIIGVCSLLYLILDAREELRALKRLELQVSEFLASEFSQ